MKCHFVCKKMHKYTRQDSVWLCFKVSHSMRPPKPTCQRNRMSWGWSRLSSSSFSRKKKVSRQAVRIFLFYEFVSGWKRKPNCTRGQKCLVSVWCVSVVLRGENAWWRERMVPRELRHRDHQPHGHGEQRPAHEEAAQRNQRLSNTWDESVNNWCHLLRCFAKHKKCLPSAHSFRGKESHEGSSSWCFISICNWSSWSPHFLKCESLHINVIIYDSGQQWPT